MHKHDFFFLVGLLTEFKLGIEFYNTACHNLNMATRKKIYTNNLKSISSKGTF